MRSYEQAVYYTKDARKTYISLRTAVGIPAGIAFFVGLCIGFVSGALVQIYRLGNPIEWALVFGSLSALVAFVLAIMWWREMVFGVEKTILALAHPGVAVEPVRISLVEPGGRVQHLEKLPGTRAQLIAVARMANAGNSLSIGALKSIFGDSGAREFQSALINNGYAAWRHSEAPQQGIRITSKGKALFMAADSPTPGGYSPPERMELPPTHAPHGLYRSLDDD